MQVYKLNVLYPWWCENFKSMFPIDHVETIVDGLEEIYGDLWEELPYKNFEWRNEQEVWMIGSYDALPQYIKVIKGNGTYYYYLYDKNEIVSEDSSGLKYRAKFILDSYMTKYNKKLNILIDKNPVVKFKHKYCDRFKKDSSNNWYIDFVEQKYLSSFNQQNAEKVRKLAYSTTESELYTNNFASYTKPSTRQLLNYADSSKTWDITNFNTILSTPSNTGRYRYMICKSSAKISTNNSKITPVNTTQTILVIPVWSNDILHAINDIDITGTQTGALSPLGENLIGFWESDLPYSFLYGMEQDSSGSITMKFAQNVCYGTTPSNIPFWEIPLNYYKKYKLVDYTQYTSGFAGKMSYMIENLDKWNPETEPALYAPQNYSEVYNNGVGNITNDFSYFIYHWNGTTSLENLKNYHANGTVPNDDPAFISMYCAFGFDDALNIAYDFGSNTNTKLGSYDNAEVITSSVSIANQIAGSAAANYYSSNVNTGLTSVQNRKSEQDQANADAVLNTAKITANAIPSGLAALSITKSIKNAAIAAADISKVWTDYALTQQRENRTLASNYNNIYSSPSTIVGNPYIKGIIPNGGSLFKTYSLELHDYDKKKVFGDILEFGRIYDTLDHLQAFDNNVYMNILDIDPYTTYYRLLRLVLENDNSMFNTPKDNDEFFVWLGQPHQIFNTWLPINCTNYEADNYIDNIEKTAYPGLKTNIKTVITNIPDKIPAESSLLIAELQAANPSAPSTVWTDIEVVTANYDHLIIRAKDTSTLYYGSIAENVLCYNAIATFTDDESVSHTEYIYDFNKVYTKNQTIPKHTFQTIYESGLKVLDLSIISFSLLFNSLSSITQINDNFMGSKYGICTPFTNKNSTAWTIKLPNNLTKLGNNFIYTNEMVEGTLEVNSPVTQFAGDINSLTIWSEQASCRAYTNGITITGSYASQFKTKYPNITNKRKLV